MITNRCVEQPLPGARAVYRLQKVNALEFARGRSVVISAIA